ncbi:hypothetical protein D3C75_1295750 [compost metagenome]
MGPIRFAEAFRVGLESDNRIRFGRIGLTAVEHCRKIIGEETLTESGQFNGFYLDVNPDRFTCSLDNLRLLCS